MLLGCFSRDRRIRKKALLISFCVHLAMRPGTWAATPKHMGHTILLRIESLRKAHLMSSDKAWSTKPIQRV